MPRIISTEPLARMIRSIAFHKRTGVLQVEQLSGRSVERGEIYFENGSLVRVRTGRETGNAALQRISEWKQITCSFQSISRPYPAVAPAAAQREAGPPGLPTRFVPQVHSQTERQARRPEFVESERYRSQANQPSPLGERTTRPLNPNRAEIALSASARSALNLSTSVADQSLILQGASLETYTPAPPARQSPSVQRWTTHTYPAIATPSGPGELPSTPSSNPRLEEETLPGRAAIFRKRPAVLVAQAVQEMERRARIVFILLNGQRTIRDIALLTHQTEYDVEQTLRDLTRRGYAQQVSG